MSAYQRTGSHIRELFAWAQDNGFGSHLFIRYWSFHTADDAFLMEARFLKTFDYMWNKRGNGERRLDAEAIRRLSDIAPRHFPVATELQELTDRERTSVINDLRNKAQRSDFLVDAGARQQEILAEIANGQRTIYDIGLDELIYKSNYRRGMPLKACLDLRFKINKMYVAAHNPTRRSTW